MKNSLADHNRTKEDDGGEIREIKDGMIENTQYEQQRNQVGKM